MRRMLVLIALLFAFPAQAVVNIDWVMVGDPGNPCDPGVRCSGAVPYEYGISKFEVTNDQYAEFLNAVAAADPNSLYNPAAGSITRSGATGAFTYHAAVQTKNHPVVKASLYDGLRFANWLNNGQPTGAQDNATTEDGAYTITPAGIAANSITRNAGASVFVTSEDEWYKGAYYDIGSMSYFDYPAGSDTQTACTLPGATANTANCDSFGLTSIGSYTGAASPNGTFDQGGNAWEWTDTIIPPSSRVVRGGMAILPAASLSASSWFELDPDDGIGIRVASSGPGVCGDGTVDVAETCDDGGTIEGDGCDANCQVEFVPEDPYPPRVYWTDNSGNKIRRADLDGGHPESLVSYVEQSSGIALDLTNGKMYWTEYLSGKIRRADLDGSNVEDLVTVYFKWPQGIALDVANGKMYWANFSTTIQRADLDGTNVEDLVTSGTSHPLGIALDVADGKMYWTDQGTDKIQRADLDGFNVEDLVTTVDATLIALDVANDRMYWTEAGEKRIRRADLDGGNIEDLIAPGVVAPRAIALDLAGGKMYWNDYLADKIQRANLDGSEIEDVRSSTDPFAIAVSPTHICGEGIVSFDETCDDAGTTPGDGCDASCQVEPGYSCVGAPSVCVFEVCGDGVVTPSEACDDFGTTPGDGCDAGCLIELGYGCSGEPSVCGEVCGDGIVTGVESCDDSNSTPGDGCDASCQIESGYSCSGEPSACGEVCGDGIITVSEGCDDLGAAPGDGCAANCLIEFGFHCGGEPSVCSEVVMPALSRVGVAVLCALVGLAGYRRIRA